jgi:flagellar biogenesis protein FliO
MSLSKIIIVVGFLLILFGLQIYLKLRSTKSSEGLKTDNNISVQARMPLSRNERADVIKIGNENFLIIFAKNSRPVIQKLAPYSVSDDV